MSIDLLEIYSSSWCRTEYRSIIHEFPVDIGAFFADPKGETAPTRPLVDNSKSPVEIDGFCPFQKLDAPWRFGYSCRLAKRRRRSSERPVGLLGE